MHPRLVPPVFGVLFGIGATPPNPSVLITRQLASLDAGLFAFLLQSDGGAYICGNCKEGTEHSSIGVLD
jgi:hypothetical protein